MPTARSSGPIWRTRPAVSSSWESKIWTRVGADPSSFTTSSTTCAGWGSSGTGSRSSSRSALRSTRRRWSNWRKRGWSIPASARAPTSPHRWRRRTARPAHLTPAPAAACLTIRSAAQWRRIAGGWIRQRRSRSRECRPGRNMTDRCSTRRRPTSAMRSSLERTLRPPTISPAWSTMQRAEWASSCVGSTSVRRLRSSGCSRSCSACPNPATSTTPWSRTRTAAALPSATSLRRSAQCASRGSMAASSPPTC